MEKIRKDVKKSVVLASLIGLIVGALLILVIRFVTYHNEKGVHYHANFAMYINGQREQFKDSFYYEEVGTGCNGNETQDPHERAHLHDNANSVIHVHDNAVTWGAFFQNIGWVVDNSLIETPKGKIYLADDKNKVQFELNGKITDNLINKVIEDKDRLLIDFGDTSNEDLQKEFNSVPATAHKYDISKDPASCGGGVRPTTFKDRLNHLF
jgi:hypothetical protein